MKKIILLVIVVMLFFPIINAVALYSAQDLAKEYMQSNEFLDSSFYYAKCEESEYYMISVVDGKANFSFFVPVEINTGKVIHQNTENTKQIIKTAHLYRTIKTKTGNNFLSQQLIDRIDNLNTILKSKNAKYDGVIKSNYSSEINKKITDTQKKLEIVINRLYSLNSALSKLQKEQNLFLDTSDCKVTDNLLYLYKTSFEGYNLLVSESINYRDSVNQIIEVIVSANIEDTTKKLILSYVEAPTNLSSEITIIFNSLSTTNQFYQEIVSEFERTGPNSTIEKTIIKLQARHSFYLAKSGLYGYDNDLNGNLNNAINYILNESTFAYWKDRKTVSELSQTYNQILDLYNKGRYTEVMPKITQARNQVRKINKEGFIEYEEKINYNYFIFAGSSLLILLLIMFFFKKYSNKKKQNKKKSGKDFLNDSDPLFNKRDPFK